MRKISYFKIATYGYDQAIEESKFNLKSVIREAKNETETRVENIVICDIVIFENIVIFELRR